MPTGSSRGQHNTNCEKRPQAAQRPNSHAAAAEVGAHWSKLPRIGRFNYILQYVQGVPHLHENH